MFPPTLVAPKFLTRRYRTSWFWSTILLLVHISHDGIAQCATSLIEPPNYFPPARQRISTPGFCSFLVLNIHHGSANWLRYASSFSRTVSCAIPHMKQCDTTYRWNPSLVREHFSSPLLQLAEEDQGKTFVLVECPSKRHSYSKYRSVWSRAL